MYHYAFIWLNSTSWKIPLACARTLCLLHHQNLIFIIDDDSHNDITDRLFENGCKVWRS